MRCCGTLEFICDFQAHCLAVQNKFIEKDAKEDVECVKDDGESNKENTAPIISIDNLELGLTNNIPKTSLLAEPTDDPILPGKSVIVPEKAQGMNVLADITENHCQEAIEAHPRGIKRTRESIRKNKPFEPKFIERPKKNGELQTKLVEKGKRVPVIVKQDKDRELENESSASPVISNIKSNQLLISNTSKPLENKAQSPVTRIESVISTADGDVVIRKSVIEKPRKATINNDKSDNLNLTRRKGKTFGKMSELMSEEQKKTIEKNYIVDMSVINEDLVRSHCIINDKKQISCKLCNLVYPRIDKCYVHIWGHLDMKPYRCITCHFATVTVTNIRSHIRKSHLKIKPFECHVCQKRYVTAVLLDEHLNTHTGARPFECKFCSFSSASRQVLSYHHKTHKTVKDITCDICQKQFYTKGRMRAHMLVHNKDKTLMCKFCSHHFTSSGALQRHYDKAHSKDYVCATCGKRTKSRKALHNHQNVHGEAKFKCSLCPNVYKSSHILKEHILKHEGIRAYKCDVCKKDFAQQSHLAAHKAVHSEKRFKCPGCQRPFNRQDNMKMHTKRCEPFLADPELKSLLHRPRYPKTTNSTTEERVSDELNTSLDKTEIHSSKEIRETLKVDIKPQTLVESVQNSENITQSVLSLECF